MLVCQVDFRWEWREDIREEWNQLAQNKKELMPHRDPMMSPRFRWKQGISWIIWHICLKSLNNIVIHDYHARHKASIPSLSCCSLYDPFTSLTWAAPFQHTVLSVLRDPQYRQSSGWKNNKTEEVVEAINTTNRSECMHAPTAINYAGYEKIRFTLRNIKHDFPHAELSQNCDGTSDKNSHI